MKVVHLISGGDVGGAKTHVHSLLLNLNKTIHVDMICFTDGEFAQEARELGIPTYIISKSFFATLSELTSFIKKGGYDIVHCHGSKANMYGALLRRRLGLPVVTTVHSDYRLDYMGRPVHRLTYGTINSVALRMLDYHIGVSDPIAEMLVSRGFDPQTTFAIYNGLDYSNCHANMSRDEYFASVGFDVKDDDVVFGIAARLNPVKDFPTLIKAFGATHTACSNTKLIIAGDGEQRQMLEELAESLGVSDSICFAGWVSDTASFYGAIDVNMLTSLSETFPYALTEGARMYRATISSRVGGVPLLIDNGVNGFTFTPGSVDELAQCMIKLASSPELRQQMGSSLGEKARRLYSIDATIQRQLEIYSTMLRRQGQDKRQRRGVLICGAYGKGNAGDDAILEAIVAEMRQLDSDMPIYVLSRTPKKTEIKYRVSSVHTFNAPGFWRIMRKTKLYISGGGSLIQDVTSTRSLMYYLSSIRWAKQLGNKVLMYGCGIGPVNSDKNRKKARGIINKYVDAITLREASSMAELASMGVTKPDIILSADPALTLAPADKAAIDSYFISNGIEPNGKFACFALRPWPGFEERVADFAAAADYAYEKYGLTPLLLPIEPNRDVAASELVLDAIKAPGKLLPCPNNGSLIIGIMSRMEIAVSMRLHALIFAAGASTPLAGVAYDPKVNAFMDYIGQSNYCQLEGLSADKLKVRIDTAIHLAQDGSITDNTHRLLNAEKNNTIVAAKLMGIEDKA